MGRRHRIARLAIALCILSVIGPWLHVALHDHLLAHHHDSFGRQVAAHDHDPVGTRFAKANALTAKDGTSRLVTPGSLHDIGHQHVAVAVIPHVVIGPLAVDRPTRNVDTPCIQCVVSRSGARASARGPPAAQV